MKKLLLILLCLPLLFTTCKKEDEPVPLPIPAPPFACCTFSGTVNGTSLTYNPTDIAGNVLCTPATVSKNANGDIEDISLQFFSYCGTSIDWQIIISLNAIVNAAPPIISLQTYNVQSGGPPLPNDLVSAFDFWDYNCSFQYNTYGPDHSGTVMFDVDWANNEIGGKVEIAVEDPSGGLPKTVEIDFSDLPFLMK
jgi:hypothetical protein